MIAAAAAVFVATFRVRPPYVDFVLAAAAVVLITLSARRSTALWTAGARADEARSPRDAWLASAAFTIAALAALAVLGALAGGSELLGANATPFRPHAYRIGTC